MALSNITVKGVTPDLAILGNYQRFSYEDNVASFQLDNIFVSTTLIPSQMNIEFRNTQLSGFRWYHTTTSTDTFGSLALQSFVNAEPDGTDIIIFGQDGSINFVAPITVSSLSIGNDLDMNSYRIINLADPVNSQDAATKAYVDDTIGSRTVTVTGAVTGSGSGTINTTLTPITTSQISNFDTAVKSYNLNQFVAPMSTLNVDGQKISHLGWGTTGTDAASIERVNDMLQAHTVTLTGAVTGSGSGTINTTLTPITTSQISNFDTAVRINRLDQMASPTASINMDSQQITNLATPTLTTDAATKDYVDKYARSAMCYSTNNPTTNTLTANVAQKIAGITDFFNLGFTTTGVIYNRVVYSGPEFLSFFVCGGVQLSSTVSNINVNLEIVKNGTTGLILPVLSNRVVTANVPMLLSIYSRAFYLATNDYIELYIKATANTTITVSNMVWMAKTI
jgi:hypothetical protein